MSDKYVPTNGMAIVAEKINVFLQSADFGNRLVAEVLGGLVLMMVAAHRSAGVKDKATLEIVADIQRLTRDLVPVSLGPKEPETKEPTEAEKVAIDAALGRILADAFEAEKGEDEPKTAVEVAMEMLRRRDERESGGA